jgi:hypothetical protein
MWQALELMQVPKAYIRVLAKLYNEQEGEVIAGTTSRKFRMRRGTKQGDPLSPALFNAVMEKAIASVQSSWRGKGLGVQIGSVAESILCNLRFADDSLIFATSLGSLQEMFTDFAHSTNDVGLKLHFGKTKILSNVTGGMRDCGSGVEIAGHQIQILPLSAGTMYLGRFLCFEHVDDTELAHRIRKAWAKFHQYRNELTGRAYALNDKLKLFEAVVTPCVLYGCSA